jgi:hypothetical protein
MFKNLLISFVIVFLSVNSSLAQENSSSASELNLENTITISQDTLIDTLITNHISLKKEELNTFSIVSAHSIYGDHVGGFIKTGVWYNFGATPQKSLVIKKIRDNKEWLFYSFICLFFFVGLINALYSSYVGKLFRGYINEGFLFFQARDQMSQYPVASSLLNVFFFLTAAFFIFFWINLKNSTFDQSRWATLTFIFLIIALVYLVKLIFLNLIGWLVNQQEVFRTYTFIVFLNNKIIGILLLFSSFGMAFSSKETASSIANITLTLLSFLFLFRLLKGYNLFSRQAKLSIFSYLLAVFSLEILPTAVIIKLISRDFVTLIQLSLF